MTELRGTFDAAKADWCKLFGEAPKSIDNIDVIGLHDKTIINRQDVVDAISIDRVLEIKDKFTVSADFDDGYAMACRVIKNRVLALKGEQG